MSSTCTRRCWTPPPQEPSPSSKASTRAVTSTSPAPTPDWCSTGRSPARIRSHIRWRPNPDGDNQFRGVRRHRDGRVGRGGAGGRRVSSWSGWTTGAGWWWRRSWGMHLPPGRSRYRRRPCRRDEDLPPMLREAIRHLGGGSTSFRRVLAAEAPPQVDRLAPRPPGGAGGAWTPPLPCPPGRCAALRRWTSPPWRPSWRSIPPVKEAAVQVYQDRPGEQRLVAYVVYDPMERATGERAPPLPAGRGGRRHWCPRTSWRWTPLPRAGDGSVARGGAGGSLRSRGRPCGPQDRHRGGGGQHLDGTSWGRTG